MGALPEFAPHFCRGSIPVAFVFSVPGEAELCAGKPVAARSGENLSSALAHLHRADPECFPSLDRYDYRITNAAWRAMGRRIGDGRPEASKREILKDANVARVLQDLEGCGLVVLSGERPQWLASALSVPKRSIVEVCHVGMIGLNTTYRVPDRLNLASGRERREHRVLQWAEDVLRQMAETCSPDTAKGGR